MPGHVILSHGSGSGPDATKVAALARVAGQMGFSTERPDYGDCDGADHAAAVAPRVQRLCARIRAAATAPILVGSSMGAFTTGLASLREPCAGLFLMALPAAIPGCGQAFDMAADVPRMLVHGFDDEVCPADAALEIARRLRMPTLLVPDTHRLSAHVAVIEAEFRRFLQQVAT